MKQPRDRVLLFSVIFLLLAISLLAASARVVMGPPGVKERKLEIRESIELGKPRVAAGQLKRLKVLNESDPELFLLRSEIKELENRLEMERDSQ